MYLTKMMKDIVEVHFNIGHNDYARIEPLLRAAGYRINRSAQAILADGDELICVSALPRLLLKDCGKSDFHSMLPSLSTWRPSATRRWWLVPMLQRLGPSRHPINGCT